MSDDLYRLRVAREWLPRLTDLRAPGYVVETLRDLVDKTLADLATCPAIIFKPVDLTPGSERWLIHKAGEPPKVYPSTLLGLTAAWLAIRDEGRTDTVRAGDFATPGASQPATIVRKAIREDAIAWVEHTTGCRELANAMRAIKIKGGLLRYIPAPNSPIFITGDD